METDVVCPDCGKLIAPPGAVEEARRCRCAETSSRDTLESREKKCYVCGASLERRKRLKDSRGRYWCAECAAADKRSKKRGDELRCPDCGRRFPAKKLVYFQAHRVCPTCFREREKELERKVARAGVQRIQSRYEKARLMILAAVVVGLLALAWLLQRLL